MTDVQFSQIENCVKEKNRSLKLSVDPFEAREETLSALYQIKDKDLIAKHQTYLIDSLKSMFIPARVDLTDKLENNYEVLRELDCRGTQFSHLDVKVEVLDLQHCHPEIFRKLTYLPKELDENIEARWILVDRSYKPLPSRDVPNYLDLFVDESSEFKNSYITDCLELNWEYKDVKGLTQLIEGKEFEFTVEFDLVSLKCMNEILLVKREESKEQCSRIKFGQEYSLSQPTVSKYKS